MQEWEAESPQTVGPLIPQVHSALACLPPLQTRKRAAASTNAAPETISLLDDEDESEGSSSCPSTVVEKAAADKAPESIVLD